MTITEEVVVMVERLMDANEMELSPQAADVCYELLGRSSKEVAEYVQVVSLGSSCATKLSLRRLGLSEASLPFDWMRTRVAGLIHWLQNDFDGFFRVSRPFEVGAHNQRMTVFRSKTHSFWHDNIENDKDREKLWRRVDRFMKLSKLETNVTMPTHTQRTLLFVRSIAGTDELELTETLHFLLKSIFGKTGRKVVLLLILDDQCMTGPILHKQHEDILFWLQPTFKGELSLDGESPSPYEDAVSFAIARILGDAKGLYPGGSPNEGAHPSVDHSTEILDTGGPFREVGARHTESGLWAGDYVVNGEGIEVLLSAFQGIEGIEDSVPNNHQGSDRCKVGEQNEDAGNLNVKLEFSEQNEDAENLNVNLEFSSNIDVIQPFCNVLIQPDPDALQSKDVPPPPDLIGCKATEPIVPLRISLNSGTHDKPFIASKSSPQVCDSLCDAAISLPWISTYEY